MQNGAGAECLSISLMDAYLRQRKARRHHTEDPFAELAREEATIVEAPKIHKGLNVIYKTENGLEYQFTDAIDDRIAQFFRKLHGE
ncbi:hypothetical protein QR680_009783 [Steinernema hermaphroditum]|uniref:Uncharacterized protein n=1 Tax=Steinernema hermaphroditum TaxID=289476 RepID=A0AA39IND3_9BILA|nr:hypothetical protein QR680_009783 [Steinernema hermaphroditum]